MAERATPPTGESSHIYSGMPVTTEGGQTGIVRNIIPASERGAEQVEIAWDDDGESLVLAADCLVEQGQMIAPAGPDAAQSAVGGRRSAAGKPEVAEAVEESGSRIEIADGSSLASRPETADASARREELVLPVIEEQIVAGTRWREAGAVRFHLRTEEVPERVNQQAAREELVVEEVEVGRVLADGETVAPRQEGDAYIIPIVVEEPVLVMRRVLAREMHVRKRVATTTETVETTLRRVRVEIDPGPLADRVHHDGTDIAGIDSQEAPAADASRQ